MEVQYCPGTQQHTAAAAGGDDRCLTAARDYLYTRYTTTRYPVVIAYRLLLPYILNPKPVVVAILHEYTQSPLAGCRPVYKP